MDVEDLIKLVLAFLFFVLPTLGRILRAMMNRRQAPQRDDSHEDDGFEDAYDYEEEYDEENPYAQEARGPGEASGSRYDYKLDEHLAEQDVPELVAHDTYEAEPVEVGPGTSDPGDPARERMRRQLGEVFRSLGIEVRFEQPEAARPERVVEEAESGEGAGEETEELVADETPEAYERWLELDRLERERRAVLERAEDVRLGRRLNARSVRSLEVIRDAIVLDALLTRPEFGQLPLKRSPR